jgi:adenosylmethionine-8-amino-7-oxononanoate aminotransferase
VLLIADEIAVGFGRTGTLFACEQAGIRPDFLCLSKGLTAGYLPMSVVLTTDTLYQAFYDDYVKLTAFLHSHSYTGNPLACAVAVETLRIFRDDDVIARNRVLARRMAAALAPLADHPRVAEVRQTGMIAAVEFVKDRATGERFDWRERRGLRAYTHALGEGALLRPIGNVLYLMPPYVITPEQIDWLAGVAARAVDAACA